MFETLKTLYKDEDAVATVEYALLLALLLAALVFTWRGFGCSVRTVIWRASNAFDVAGG